jgi:hypothetical protein
LLLPVTVPAAPPAGAVPFYCSGTAEIGTEAVLECRRSDTREVITPVPSGMFLFVTDVLTNPASAAVDGVFTASLGRKQEGDAFLGHPSLDLIGQPEQALNFTTPYVVLWQNEDLLVANFAGSDFDIEVRASGYMAQTFVEPLGEIIFLDGFEDPSASE